MIAQLERPPETPDRFVGFAEGRLHGGEVIPGFRTLGIDLGEPQERWVAAGLAEIGLFLSTAPINAILLRTAPIFLRASAMAVAIFAIHLFGDLWSPALLGLFLDYLPITLGMMALPATFGVAAYIWWPRKREAEGGAS